VRTLLLLTPNEDAWYAWRMNWFGPSYGFFDSIPANGLLLIVLVLWILFWKGLALWHAGRRGQGWWFVILLILNTAGILDIIYLFAVCKLTFSQLFSK
jgi:hypothetical protein